MAIARYAIIAAGGQGLRMGADIPKQFLLLAGRPVLMYTLELFKLCEAVVLILPREQIEYWRELQRRYTCGVDPLVVEGGASRFESVRRGLVGLRSLGVDPRGIVAVHDAVRPLLSPEVLDKCFVEAELSGACLPVRPLVDSLREREAGGGSHALDRANYVAVHTPQVFYFSDLVEAYSVSYRDSFTDDASVWESYYPARKISLIEGNSENFKLTTPLDMCLAELLLSKV